eukprot:TRINITY_DN198_c1_g1_i1.p1 TRINITY_DN198_c1_g1~~TRINITY_DN198_c1_g1_i1.p1  ORF type:complete len:356 (+),score=83.82 TRINITY_DN198_c1_g1_i1:1316-2383(+)
MGSSLSEKDLGQQFRLMATHMEERGRLRSLVYGIVCTPIVGVVLYISRKPDGGLNYFQSAPLDWQNHSDQLLFPIVAGDQVLGYRKAEYCGYTANVVLGEGASATVYSAEGENNVVLKVFNHQEYDDGRIPLAYSAEREVLQQFQENRPNGFPELVKHEENDACLVLAPRGSVVQHLDASDVVRLAKLLIEVNGRGGIVHRDIRPDNMIRSNGKVFLFDWAFSVKEGKSGFAGSGSTASNAVLAQLSQSGYQDVEYGIKDDLESLIKTYCMLQLFHRNDCDKFNACGKDAGKRLKFWIGKEEESIVFQQLVQHCQKVEEGDDMDKWVEELGRMLDGGSQEEATSSSSSSSLSSIE